MGCSFDIDALLRRVKGKRVAVISGAASWIPGVGNLGEWLLAQADVRGFLGLEHGLRGELQAGVRFDDYTDPRSGKPVFSYYREGHTFPKEFLESVDLVVYHMQEISHSAYTYKHALAQTLKAVAGTRTAVLVVDRPSPAAHLAPDGPAARLWFPLDLPMTLHVTQGELALWQKSEERLDVDLEVLPVAGWRRDMRWAETGLPWIPPSPNIPTAESGYAFAMTWMLEATNLSEGRGTCKPFEYVGAPFVDGEKLAARMNALGLPGVVFREVFFQPAQSKHAGEVCSGVHLMLSDVSALRPVEALFHLMQELARLCGEKMVLKESFDKRMGCGPWTVERLAEARADEYLASAAEDGARFAKAALGSLVY